MLSNKLSDLQVRQAKSTNKKYKLSDGLGLNLEIHPSGSKYWRLSYRYQQKQKTLAVGVYPVISLAEARSITLEAKKLLHQNIDPGKYKKQQKLATSHNTFKQVAEEWHKKASGLWSKDHARKVWLSIETDVIPYLGDMPINDISSRDVLHVIRRIEGRDALDVAGRVKQRISKVFNYAIQIDIADNNPAGILNDVIRTRKVRHRKSLQLDEIPYFLRALDHYKGYPITRYALQFIAYTFVRPGELRSAEWQDIHLDKAEWRIPAEKMKMNEEHIVPLSCQAVELLKVIQKISGEYNLVFPGTHDFNKPMSENTLTYAIRKRLGFDATAHGFRTTASTILNEKGYRADVIERQLAHGERNKVRAAYNRSQYLKERTEMMQWYSDHLDSLKTGSNIVPIFNK